MKASWYCIAAVSVSLHLVAAPQSGEEYVAHEWGTFTSVQGADGSQMVWNPFLRTDLPGFVYHRANANVPEWRTMDYLTKSVMTTRIRMETPVIYFYSDTARTVDVTVKFPQGKITEWYPQATALGPYNTPVLSERVAAAQSFIQWKGLDILARGATEVTAEKLIREKDGNHYYEARDVDANFVRMKSPKARGTEYERDLFYRGAGDFHAPLTVKLLPGDVLSISTTNAEPMNNLFVLTVRNGMARYQPVSTVSATETQRVQLNEKAFAPLSDVREQIMREMSAALVKQGLYEREAAAMVNTWKHQWFEEEGVRVLYLLPRAWTDRALPLTISPAPKEVARVMVGRAEVITPAMELELGEQISRYQAGQTTEAVAAVRRLGIGRFLEPATRRLTSGKADKAFSQAAWKLAQLASNGEVTQPEVAEKTMPPVTETKKTASLWSPALDQFNAF